MGARCLQTQKMAWPPTALCHASYLNQEPCPCCARRSSGTRPTLQGRNLVWRQARCTGNACLLTSGCAKPMDTERVCAKTQPKDLAAITRHRYDPRPPPIQRPQAPPIVLASKSMRRIMEHLPRLALGLPSEATTAPARHPISAMLSQFSVRPACLAKLPTTIESLRVGRPDGPDAS